MALLMLTFTGRLHWLSALFFLLFAEYSVSFSVETTPLVVKTRRCTLYSKDGDNIIGTILERRSSDGVHAAMVGSMDDVNQGIAFQTTVPYFETADSVGSSVWPSALAGSILLHCSELKTLTKDAEILELGSGLGLGGLVAGKSAARCVLSDNDHELVERLRKHVLENQDSLGENVSVQHLDWRDSDPSKPLSEEDRFDFCLGLDVAYYYHLFGPLVNTIRQKLKDDNSIVCVLGQANRESQWTLFHHIRDGGYNQITDEHEAPWEGSATMLLYKLEVGVWTDGEDEGRGSGDLDGVIAISTLR